jgi:hypothetical protein
VAREEDDIAVLLLEPELQGEVPRPATCRPEEDGVAARPNDVRLVDEDEPRANEPDAAAVLPLPLVRPNELRSGLDVDPFDDREAVEFAVSQWPPS